MVKLLFLGAIARITINNELIEDFPLKQGVREGCLIALYLFILVGEALNQRVKKEVALAI